MMRKLYIDYKKDDVLEFLEVYDGDTVFVGPIWKKVYWELILRKFMILRKTKSEKLKKRNIVSDYTI